MEFFGIKLAFYTYEIGFTFFSLHFPLLDRTYSFIQRIFKHYADARDVLDAQGSPSNGPSSALGGMLSHIGHHRYRVGEVLYKNSDYFSDYFSYIVHLSSSLL